MSRIEFIKAKMVDLDTAILKVNNWKMKGDKIVLTNGCFDILHKGHVTYLAKAADFGTRLVVAINTDASVKKLEKGADRPINSEEARMQLIASLGFVDLVLLFHEDTPYEVIQVLKPDVLVKGADYDPICTDPLEKNTLSVLISFAKMVVKLKLFHLKKDFLPLRLLKRLSTKLL